MSQSEDSNSPANAEIPEIRQYTELPEDSEREKQAKSDLNCLSNDRGYTKARTHFDPDDGEDPWLKRGKNKWVRMAEMDNSTNHLSGSERDNPDYEKHLVVLRCQLDLKEWHERRACHFADKIDWDFNFGGTLWTKLFSPTSLSRRERRDSPFLIGTDSRRWRAIAQLTKAKVNPRRSEYFTHGVCCGETT